MDDVSGNLPSGGTETADPVEMIEGILEREENPPTKGAADPKPKQQPKQQPEQQDDPAEPDEEAPADQDGEENEDADDAEQQDEQPEPEPEVYTVKVDGKEIQVNRDELVRGYQRLSDYTRKTQEVAATRQQVEAEAQRIAAERAHYAQNLEQLSTVLQTTLPPRPPLEMSQTDPLGYTQQNARWEAAVQQLQGVFAEQQRIQQQQQQHFERTKQQTLAAAAEQLVEMLPEWRDPKRASTEKRQVAEFLRTVGYSDGEIAQAADPRAIAMARDAMKYRELMATKPSVDQRIKSAPKVVKPGSGNVVPDKRKALKSTIQRSGGTDMDAIARLIDLG